MITTKIVNYCAEEVERQHRGPIQVGWMVEAWEWALNKAAHAPTCDDIMWLGKLVERNKNTGKSWRNCGVRVGNHIPPNPRELDRLMDRWHSNLDTMTPEEAYKCFEEIHPFIDGNGRVGKIIYNWLNCSLNYPKMPPNFFGGENP